MHPRLQSQKWRLLRLSTFIATGLSAFAPIAHAASIFPYEQLDQQAGLRFYYLEGLVIVMGVLFYAVSYSRSREGLKQVTDFSAEPFPGVVATRTL